MALLEKTPYAKPFRQADEIGLLSESIVVSIWNASDDEGRHIKLHFKLGRQNAKDPTSKPYSTLTLASLFELPEALSKLGFAFSKLHFLPEAVRIELKEYAEQMAALVNIRKSNGEASKVIPLTAKSPILGF